MGLFSKLFTALRGMAHETGDTIVNTQGMRILEQEIRDAQTHLDEAKENLTKVIAEQMGVEREVKRLQEAVSEYEGYTMDALNKGNDSLAAETAEKVAYYENELEAQRSVLEGYKNSVNSLKETIRNTDRNIKAMEREISVVKTTASVHKANEAAAARFSGSNSALRTATDSLERIKKKQQQKSDQMAAAMQLQKEESGENLQTKLKEAGIISNGKSANDVLARIKAKREGGA